MFGNFFESLARTLVVWITNFLPVKVIRDSKGVPFLYRYHLFLLWKDGPGICFHRFVKSDPGRGYHDHPWHRALSFILSGGYEERILQSDGSYRSYNRSRFTFNYLNGVTTFHRVMIGSDRNDRDDRDDDREDRNDHGDYPKDAWTIFLFGSRRKTWGMVGLNDGIYRAMSTQISDLDGGWWQDAKPGLSIHSHLPLAKQIMVTVDIVIISRSSSKVSGSDAKVLLIKRGKEPFKNFWAFPGGRVEAKDGNLLSAAYRELQEETSIQADQVNLKFVKTIGNDQRDPRGFCLTNVFLGIIDGTDLKVRAGDDAVDYEWFPLTSSLTGNMSFDHEEILQEIINTIF